MKLWKKSLTVLTAMSLVFGAVAVNEVQAAKKRSSAAKSKPVGDDAPLTSDPGAPTLREHRLLKWGPVDPPDRGKSPEFFVRGAFVELTEMTTPDGKTRKDFYHINLLPVEVVENEYRVITLDNFTNGLKVPAFLPKEFKKQFEPGAMTEVHLFYTTKEEQAIGHAKMIAFSYNENIVPYPAGPAAYVKKGGLDPEQYLNALKGMEMYGKNPKDEQLKTGLDALASSSPNAEVKAKATALLASMFGAQPSGQALLPPEPVSTSPEEKPSKKKK